MTNHNESSPLGRLRQVVVPALTQEQEGLRRERVVARIAELQRLELSKPTPFTARRWRVRRRPVVKSVAVLGLAAAACFAVALAWRELSNPGQLAVDSPAAPAAEVVVRSGRVELTSEQSALQLGPGHKANASAALAWVAQSEQATLVLPSAADLSLTHGSRVRIEHQARVSDGASWADRVQLESGSLALRVPKLGAAKLSVRTSDALVEVHGTEFTVEVAGQGAQSSTRVLVREGVVSVTANGERTLLGAGQSWSSKLDARPSPVPEAPSATAVEAAAPPAISGVSNKGSSDLAEQNRLLQSALDARKRGATDVALDQLEALMTRFPRSELAHNARVEHFRLLLATGQSERARASAQAYLRRYPKGFARDEASRLSR